MAIEAIIWDFGINKNAQWLIDQFKGYAENLGAGTVVRRVLEESGYWDKWAKAAEEEASRLQSRILRCREDRASADDRDS